MNSPMAGGIGSFGYCHSLLPSRSAAAAAHDHQAHSGEGAEGALRREPLDHHAVGEPGERGGGEDDAGEEFYRASDGFRPGFIAGQMRDGGDVRGGDGSGEDCGGIEIERAAGERGGRAEEEAEPSAGTHGDGADDGQPLQKGIVGKDHGDDCAAHPERPVPAHGSREEEAGAEGKARDAKDRRGQGDEERARRSAGEGALRTLGAIFREIREVIVQQPRHIEAEAGEDREECAELERAAGSQQIAGEGIAGDGEEIGRAQQLQPDAEQGGGAGGSHGVRFGSSGFCPPKTAISDTFR